ncbi:LPS export ABC transporter ATP-binding protein [Limnoglobus roseus]|uniref:LPS export ABC transporter ATP-binding protein n=1 Tax=Limnoglobus roseus TaxID=2598579 RepID=A0A5C1ASA5_9BACT|nr:LPS export ABC transporter ATP-binding protein [Limnoglobus roseus]QEL21037.1 LPS export ABC transporter ATP-binding protein [Limnoglobus roseus]
MALLEVRGLVKRFGSRTVVNGVSFDVNAGEVVGLLGPNGAGKTTSFRMATGQLTPNEGQVLFADKDVTTLPMFRRARLGMGYLSQEQSVFKKLSVEQNLLAILEALPRSRSLGRRLTRTERWDRTDQALTRFNLQHVRKNNSARCSGGEKRRLEIARCLVCEPLLILLDEPFAAVDPLTTEDIRHNIRDLATQGIGVLLTDHNVREVLKITDRSYLIKDGKVIAYGTPDHIKSDPVAIREYLGNTFADDYVPLRQATPSQIPWAETTRIVPPAPPPESLSPSPILDPYLPTNAEKNPPDDDPPPPPNGGRPVPKPSPNPIPRSGPTLNPIPANLLPGKSPSVTVQDEMPPPPAAPKPPETVLGPPLLPPIRGPVPSGPAPFGPSGPGSFSQPARQMLEYEKMRRMVDLLNTDGWQNGWHELALKGLDAVPVLLEALERRQPNIRHLAFRLLEQITGESLSFQADEADDVRLRQIAYLRAKLEPRRAA